MCISQRESIPLRFGFALDPREQPECVRIPVLLRAHPGTYAVEIQTLPICELQLATYNPRADLKPGDAEYEYLKRSMNEFGCVEPLVWNRQTGNLVGGHQRLKVLIEQGCTEAVVSVVDLPPAKEKALNIALNKIEGAWDDTKLAHLLAEIIEDVDVDLELTGFDLAEATGLIEDLLAGLTDDEQDGNAEEETDSLPLITQPGDLILLGRDPLRQHRLLCGDATDADAVKLLMDGERARLFMTDPPYLVGYTDPQRHSPAKKPEGEPSHPNWDDPRGQEDLYLNYNRVAVQHAIAKDAACYCWHASLHQSQVEEAWVAAGIRPHQHLLWLKDKAAPGRSWYRWRHEPCLMGWQEGHKPRRVARRKQTTVWEEQTPAGAERPDHPTPKPVGLFERAMRQHTIPASTSGSSLGSTPGTTPADAPGMGVAIEGVGSGEGEPHAKLSEPDVGGTSLRRGDICYEPFAGSGTQFVAAERLGRRCFGLEREPRYCDLIVRRFIRLAGLNAVSEEVAARYGLAKEAVSP